VIELKEDGEIYLVDKSLWSELLGESTFHFSTLHSERFTAAIEQWGFCFSQGIQCTSSYLYPDSSKYRFSLRYAIKINLR